MLARALLSALALSAVSGTPIAGGTAPAAVSLDETSPREAGRKDPRRIKLEATVHRLDAELTKLDAEYRGLLGDPWMRRALRYFGEAQLAVTRMLDGDGVDTVAVGAFHSNLDEFLRALESLVRGYRPNTTQQGQELKEVPQPSTKVAKELARELEKLQKLANDHPDLCAVTRMSLNAESTLEEALAYARCVFQDVDVLLYARGMGQITGEGRRKTDELLGVHLRALRESVEELVDAEGRLVVPLDVDGEPLDDPLARVKERLATAEKMAGLFRNAYSHARERTAIVQDRLQALRRNLLAPRVLKKPA